MPPNKKPHISAQSSNVTIGNNCEWSHSLKYLIDIYINKRERGGLYFFFELCQTANCESHTNWEASAHNPMEAESDEPVSPAVQYHISEQGRPYTTLGAAQAAAAPQVSAALGATLRRLLANGTLIITDGRIIPNDHLQPTTA
jgi:hypothetical protein